MGLCVELGQVPSQDGHNLSEERCLERSLRTVSASQLRPRPSPPQRGQKLAPWRPHRSRSCSLPQKQNPTAPPAPRISWGLLPGRGAAATWAGADHLEKARPGFGSAPH